jgi:hypothetical protein
MHYCSLDNYVWYALVVGMCIRLVINRIKANISERVCHTVRLGSGEGAYRSLSPANTRPPSVPNTAAAKAQASHSPT